MIWARWRIQDEEAVWLEAIEWHECICASERLSPRLLRAWRRWHAVEVHREVYKRVMAFYSEAPRAQKLIDPKNCCSSSTPYNPKIPIRLWRQALFAGGRHRTSARRGSSALALLAASMALFIIGSWSVLRDNPPVAGPTTVYRSRAGRRKEIHLRDGSTVILGPDTSLSVTFDTWVRHLTLNRGRALFDVVHHSRWPFVVQAGPGTITDVDTAFIVDRQAHKVVVTVTQGSVDVAWLPARPPTMGASTPLARVALSPILLHVGQRLSYTDLGVIRHMSRVDTKVAASWALPPVEFLNRSLSGVVRAIQPYYPLRISVSPAAGRLKLTALVYPAASDLRGWISGLPRALPVSVITTTHRVCVVLRRPTVAPCGVSHWRAPNIAK